MLSDIIVEGLSDDKDITCCSSSCEASSSSSALAVALSLKLEREPELHSEPGLMKSCSHLRTDLCSVSSTTFICAMLVYSSI